MRALLLLLLVAANAGAEGVREERIKNWDDRLNLMQSTFGRLRLAADIYFEELLLTPVFDPHDFPNAFYLSDGEHHAVGFNRVMIECPDVVDAAVFILGHEIGHAVQDRVFGRTGPPKALESQADYIGLELALRAGYTRAQLAKSFRAMASCAASAGRMDRSGDTHPSDELRAKGVDAHLKKLAVDLADPAKRLRFQTFVDALGNPEASVAAKPIEGRRNGYALRRGGYVPSARIAIEKFDADGALRGGP